MDVDGLQRPIAFVGEDDADTSQCREMFVEADRFIRSFPWCKSVIDAYVGDCVGGIVALILFHIETAADDVDDWIWVVVGDLPSAYIAPATDSATEALEAYLYQMSRWVDAARRGLPVEDLIPVNVPPTPEWAEDLSKRLDFLRREILPTIRAE